MVENKSKNVIRSWPRAPWAKKLFHLCKKIKIQIQKFSSLNCQTSSIVFMSIVRCNKILLPMINSDQIITLLWKISMHDPFSLYRFPVLIEKLYVECPDYLKWKKKKLIFYFYSLSIWISINRFNLFYIDTLYKNKLNVPYIVSLCHHCIILYTLIQTH